MDIHYGSFMLGALLGCLVGLALLAYTTWDE